MPATKRLLGRINNENAMKRKRKSLPRSIVPESKYNNKSIDTSGVTNVITACVDIGAGTNINNRIGRKIRIKSVEYMFRVPSDVPVRACLYVPKDPDAVLSIAGSTGSIRNEQFWTVHDMLWEANGSQTSGCYRHTFPLGMVVEFSGSGDVVKNNLKLILQTDSSATFEGHTKVWYTDA